MTCSRWSTAGWRCWLSSSRSLGPRSRARASLTSSCLWFSGGPYASGLAAPQAEVLAYMSFDLSVIGYSITSIFFGLYGLCLGYLVFRSTFLPRVSGILMAFGALSYLTYGFAHLLVPGFAIRLVPWIQLSSLLGEGSFTLWLLLVGVDVKRWEERASAA